MALGLHGTLGETGFGEVCLGGEPVSSFPGEKQSLPPSHTEEEINWPINLQLDGREALMPSISG